MTTTRPVTLLTAAVRRILRPARPAFVLLDRYGVVDIATDPAAIGRYVIEKVTAGEPFDVVSIDGRCRSCGENTAGDDPCAPQCPELPKEARL